MGVGVVQGFRFTGVEVCIGRKTYNHADLADSINSVETGTVSASGVRSSSIDLGAGSTGVYIIKAFGIWGLYIFFI